MAVDSRTSKLVDQEIQDKITTLRKKIEEYVSKTKHARQQMDELVHKPFSRDDLQILQDDIESYGVEAGALRVEIKELEKQFHGTALDDLPKFRIPGAFNQVVSTYPTTSVNPYGVLPPKKTAKSNYGLLLSDAALEKQVATNQYGVTPPKKSPTNNYGPAPSLDDELSQQWGVVGSNYGQLISDIELERQEAVAANAYGNIPRDLDAEADKLIEELKQDVVDMEITNLSTQINALEQKAFLLSGELNFKEKEYDDPSSEPNPLLYDEIAALHSEIKEIDKQIETLKEQMELQFPDVPQDPIVAGYSSGADTSAVPSPESHYGQYPTGSSPAGYVSAHTSVDPSPENQYGQVSPGYLTGGYSQPRTGSFSTPDSSGYSTFIPDGESSKDNKTVNDFRAKCSQALTAAGQFFKKGFTALKAAMTSGKEEKQDIEHNVDRSGSSGIKY